jgi:hypothetical protein
MNKAQLTHFSHCDSAFFLHFITKDELNRADTIVPLWFSFFLHCITTDELSTTDTFKPLWLGLFFTSSLQMNRAELIYLNRCDSALYTHYQCRWAEQNWYIEPLWLSSLLTSSLQTNRGELIHWTIVTHLFFHFITTDELSSTDTIKPLWHRLFTDFITTDEMSRTDAFDELGLKCLLMLIEYMF